MKTNLYKKLWDFIKPYKTLFFITVFIALFNAGISTYRPILISEIIDHKIPTKNENGIVQAILEVLGVLLIEVLGQLSFLWFSANLAQNIVYDIRAKLYQKLLQLRIRFFNNTPLGTLITRAVSDIETISTVFNEGIQIFGDLLKIGFILFTIQLMNWRVAIIICLIFPLMYMVTRWFQRATKKSFQNERTMIAKLNSFVQEHISGMKIVQIFNREEAEYQKFRAINKAQNKAFEKTIFYFSLFFPITDILSGITLGLLIAYAFIFKDIRPGELVAYILYIQMLYRPLRQIADRFNNVQAGFVGAERVFTLIDQNEVVPNKGHITVKKLTGNIRFEQVNFAYEATTPILQHINFEIKAGEKVAIVGATGAGKSTIINLLTRFYDVNEGTIFIDNIPIEHIKLQNLRDRIAVVLQDVFLFNDTIMNNITLGNPHITAEMVIQASKEIKLDAFIQELPQQYNYVVKERGATLSVGQRQLIAFLRAMVHQPDILVLDEATSSIDSESEILIQNATQTLTQGKTAIMIAHRLATIQHADWIIAMDKGRIIEKGTHEELMKKENGYYKKLYTAQFLKPDTTQPLF